MRLAGRSLNGAVALMLGVALSACLAAPASGAADATDGVAADVFRNGTEVDVYYRGADNGLWERVYSDASGCRRCACCADPGRVGSGAWVAGRPGGR